ncbi:MAG: hypothetical protein J5858_15260 [Lentisphaeria bacterium]|nr:hypothetical protein [Lentisphaeria bacterium]
MHYSSRNFSNPSAGIPIPSSPEEMIRIFPQLVSTMQKMQSEIAELERIVKSMETIPGNGNQL